MFSLKIIIHSLNLKFNKPYDILWFVRSESLKTSFKIYTILKKIVIGIIVFVLDWPHTHGPFRYICFLRLKATKKHVFPLKFFTIAILSLTIHWIHRYLRESKNLRTSGSRRKYNIRIKYFIIDGQY